MSSFRPSDQRILAGVDATLTGFTLDQDGEPTAPGSVTVEVVSEATGTVVVPAGTATTAGLAAGSSQVAVTAAQTASLDRWEVRWTTVGVRTATTYVEVVGGYWASRAAIRASSDALGSAAKFDNDLVARKRKVAEDKFEDTMNVAWVPRYAWAWVSGTGRSSVVLPYPELRRIRSVRSYSDSTTFTAFGAPDIASVGRSPAGIAERIDGGVWPAGCNNLLVEWEHGHDRPPADLYDAYLRYVKSLLTDTNSAIPDRASTFQVTDGGSYSLSTPGVRGAITGIPSVDEALMAHTFQLYGIA